MEEFEVPPIDDVLGDDIQARADYDAWVAQRDEADQIEFDDRQAIDDARLEETWLELQNHEW
jgi:hypothetical protein